ncbi:hypothetical protein ARALYDRAFT_356293 [Arabidopsis lyrata subsp. lyrata]|uniref:Uncharacterized protein n=1 Tax=Arabidopsis lyrata subsp. lyrata TaxID=81972 RepID=D7MPZ1_ARALL|nr:hypothetical protein ARALYDRAFT_356293 [Arabidopsis lyrata subsp. lyrata]
MNHAVRAVEPRRRSQTADPAPAPRRVDHGPAPQNAIIVGRGEERSDRRYVAVEIRQHEDAWTEHTLLEKKLEAMLSKELKAETRFEQVKSQLRHAGMTFARETDIVTVGHEGHRRGTREATVSIRFDELQAALLRLSMTKADLKKATSNEREFRIKIEQGEEQLRRAAIRPSQGLLSSTAPAPTTRRSSTRTHRSSR